MLIVLFVIMLRFKIYTSELYIHSGRSNFKLPSIQRGPVLELLNFKPLLEPAIKKNWENKARD